MPPLVCSTACYFSSIAFPLVKDACMDSHTALQSNQSPARTGSTEIGVPHVCCVVLITRGALYCAQHMEGTCTVLRSVILATWRCSVLLYVICLTAVVVMWFGFRALLFYYDGLIIFRQSSDHLEAQWHAANHRCLIRCGLIVFRRSIKVFVHLSPHIFSLSKPCISKYIPICLSQSIDYFIWFRYYINLPNHIIIMLVQLSHLVFFRSLSCYTSWSMTSLLLPHYHSTTYHSR
jgi:hypothetical protein